MLRSKSVLNTVIAAVVLATMSFVFYQIYKSYWPKKLTIVVGSGDQLFVESLDTVLKGVSPPIQLSIKPVASEEIASDVESGQADLGIMQLDDSNFPHIRVVTLLYPELFFLVVHPDSDIQSPADLAGKVIATRQTKALEALLNYYGVSINQVKIKELHHEEAHLAFINHEVDATFRWSEPTSDTIKKLIEEGKGRLIPLDQYESMRLTIPYLVEYTLPRGINHPADPIVPASSLKTVGSYKALVANANVDRATVRAITQAIFEHQNTLVADFPLAVYMRSPLTTQMVGPYVHPGAQDYYDKDKPTFFQKYESELSFLFSAGPLLASLLLALWARLRNRQQSRAKQHIQAVHNALVRLTEMQNGQSTEEVEQRLVKILAQFTRDLNEGNINADDAQTFSLIWDRAIAMARDRKRLVNLTVH